MQIPAPLLEDIAAGKCLPFIGAGFSLNAKLPEGRTMPDWPGLTRVLAGSTGVSKTLGGPEVASVYERSFGRVQLIEAIRQSLHSDVVEPGNAHREFAQLPFDTIYTTNFDLLLEDAHDLVRRPFRSLVGELQMPFHGGPLTTNIVKMHGDLRHEEHMIITKADYDNFLEDYPVISTHLSAMLITRTGLFIGYSLSDPDFAHIRAVIRSRLGRFHRMSYIIQFNQTQKRIDKLLSDGLHVLNFPVTRGESIDGVLSDFFRTVQEELDARAGKRLRASRPEIFETMPEGAVEAATRAPDASALLTSSSNLCFVLMPFGPSFDNIYRKLIQPVVGEAGLEALRADQIYAPGLIMEQIRSAIQQARLCITDLTGRNANVLYELGIAQTLGKSVVLMTQSMADVPFDVAQHRTIVYRDDARGIRLAREELAKAVQVVLGYDRLTEIRGLIDAGMFRAAVAILGVLLEHTLRQLLMRSQLAGRARGDQGPQMLTMGQMLEMLSGAEVIGQEEGSRLREAIQIRNRAVHHMSEPTKEDATRLFDYAAAFVRKYLGSAEQSLPAGSVDGAAEG